MPKLVSVFLIVVLCSGSFAFDNGPELLGRVERPGYENLQADYSTMAQADKAGKYYVANKVTGTPRAMSLQYQSSVAVSDAEAFAKDFIAGHYAELKNSADGFRLLTSKSILGKFYFITLTQTYDGVDIFGSRLSLKATPQGKVFMAGGEIYTDVNVSPTPTLSEQAAADRAIDGIVFNVTTDRVKADKLYILPLIYDDHIEYRLCYMLHVGTSDPIADWQVFVDAHDGSVVWREDVIRYETISGSVSGMIQPATPYDEQVQEPFPNMNVMADGPTVAVTDSDGNYNFETSSSSPVGVEMVLQGPYTNINNEAGRNAWIGEDVDPGGTFNPTFNDTNSTIPEHNAFYHIQIVHDFIKALDPGLEVMDFPMTCRVNVDGTCNAYWSRQDRSVNFYRAGGGCPNIAQIGDVMYHEYGHGITNLTYYNGGSQDPDGAMHEGFSDFIAALITNQPLIGRGFYGQGSFLRSVDNNNRYPDDWSGESHNDGLIISGALWDLRELLNDDRPNYVDTLWQWAKYGYSHDFEGYFWDLLAVDDDDGDIDNGTPHASQIFYSFGVLHGIGPGISIEIQHTPLVDSEDSTVAFPVEAMVSSLFSMDEGSVIVYYSTGGDYIDLPLTNISGNDWYGEIPRQPFGTTVNYYIEAIDNINLHSFDPENAPEDVYSFYVGYDVVPPLMTDQVGPGNTIDLFGPYGSFAFDASDPHNINSTNGELHYRVNDDEEAVISMTYDSENGRFTLNQIDIGTPLATGDVVDYYFTCWDMALTPNMGRLPESGTFSFDIATSQMVGGFEDGMEDWVIDGYGWVYYPNQGYNSNRCVKTGDVFYPDNAHSILYKSEPVNCTLYDEIWLEFQYRSYLRDGDSVYVVASNSSDGPWTKYAAIGGSQSTWLSSLTQLDGMVGDGNDHVYVGLEFDSDGSDNYFGVLADQFTLYVEGPTAITGDATIPTQYSLSQNYPNPFNIHTIISFGIPQSSEVTLDIYDVLGRKVRTLLDQEMEAGHHQAIWNGRNDAGEIVTSGIYFYRLQYGENQEIKSMTLIK